MKWLDFVKEKFKKIDIKKNYPFIIVGVLIFVLILSRGIGNIRRIISGRKTEKFTEFELISEAVPVKVYRVKKMSFKDTLPVMGSIKGFKEVDLKFETSGILESFNFEEGERVQEGDIIASLDQREALMRLKYAELEFEKNRKLYEAGAIDKIKFEQSKLEYESAKYDFEKTNIYAISDGVLGRRDIDVGSYVTPNDKVGTFVDISYVYAEFNVIEQDSPKIKLGQRAEIYVDAYPGGSFKGMVDSISPVIEGRTRTQRVRIELKNQKFELKPGMFARALISTYEKNNALIIPTSAFQKKEEKYYVYVVHKEEKEVGSKSNEEIKSKKEIEEKQERETETGIVEVRNIEIGYLTQDAAEISSGLKEGELIIVDVFQEFKDKDKVEITEVQETIF